MSEQQFVIEHRPTETRYVIIDTEAASESGEAQVIGEEAYVDVEGDTGTERVLYHTLVSEEYGGRGLASTLVQAVVDDVLASGFKIVPVCPYVVKWLEKNDQYRADQVAPTPQHLATVQAHVRSQQ